MASVLEFRHLHTMLALVDCGTLSGVAARVHRTQSAISHQVKQLEDYYGTPLFERKVQPLRLTPAGQRLYLLAQNAVALLHEAERDIARVVQGKAGKLRIAVECHTCFEWLMPAMDAFRDNWPEVEMDLVSGFHVDPLALLRADRADLAIVSEHKKIEGMTYHPLFGFEIVGLVSTLHPYANKEYLTPRDFANETLVTYPVPDDMLDVVRNFLRPRGIEPKRRTAELTVAILQLVASRRGIAALPEWAVQSYLEGGYVLGKRIGKSGLRAELYAASSQQFGELSYVRDFIETVRTISLKRLKNLALL
ncbi:MAG: LysR family transcriptional regulator [Pseudomonadota bacterium]